jgi:hypothetical protein
MALAFGETSLGEVALAALAFGETFAGEEALAFGGTFIGPEALVSFVHGELPARFLDNFGVVTSVGAAAVISFVGWD